MKRYTLNISIAMNGEDGKEAMESLREEVQATVKERLMEDFYDPTVAVDVEAISESGYAHRVTSWGRPEY